MKNRTRVKICGITNLDDAKAAIAAGADALGFVFYEKSARNVTIDQVKTIIQDLPAFVNTVALFVNASGAFVNDVISETKIDLLQFHGDEAVEFCESFARPYIKAIRMKEDTDLQQLANDYASARALLLDTYVKGVPGGTGESFNWAWLENLPAGFDKSIILAGGLTADNVADAIKQAKPYAVDVSGGVEAVPGKKDSVAIQNFIKNSFN